jgi:hypothetical protein
MNALKFYQIRQTNASRNTAPLLDKILIHRIIYVFSGAKQQSVYALCPVAANPAIL